MSTPEPPPYPGGDVPPPPGENPPGYLPPPPPPPLAPPPGMPQYGAPVPGPGPGSSKATTSLVTGIIGLLCCGAILGVVAIITGRQATAEAAAAGYPQPGNAKAGIILGWIAVAWTAVVVVVWLLLFALSASGSFAPTTS